jgi:hypothetical protein
MRLAPAVYSRRRFAVTEQRLEKESSSVSSKKKKNSKLKTIFVKKKWKEDNITLREKTLKETEPPWEEDLTHRGIHRFLISLVV